MSPAAVRIEFSCTAYASARTKSAGVIFAKRSRRDLAALGAEDSDGNLDRHEHRRIGYSCRPVRSQRTPWGGLQPCARLR